MPAELISVIQEPGKYQVVGVGNQVSEEILAKYNYLNVAKKPSLRAKSLISYLNHTNGIRGNRVSTINGFIRVEALDMNAGAHHIVTDEDQYFFSYEIKALNRFTEKTLRFRKIKGIEERGSRYIVIPDDDIQNGYMELKVFALASQAWGGFVDINEDHPGPLESRAIDWVNEVVRATEHKFQFLKVK